MSQVVIYQAEDGQTGLQVNLDRETVWLSLAQMVELFGRDKSVISRHLKNVFTEGELSREPVVAKFATTAADGKTYQVDYYNLDVIISVGYRVKSQQGTRFRQWATGVLRAHIVQGYTLNEQRLREEAAKLREMRQAVDLLTRTLSHQNLVTDTGKDVLKVIDDYAYALAVLDRYDHGTLAIEATGGQSTLAFGYDQASAIVTAMKSGFDGLFGIEKDQGFKSALGAIYQTYEGRELYPSAEEKAAHLLYFVVKNHAFSDGNKRIAAAVFIAFLARAGILYRPDGGKRLADNALVALTLLIAESRPEEKDTLVKVTVNLINRSND
ncbi:MAG: virulence protein RhuM/Fic/DOC family protein [Betaproteobacteria bacterium]|nr:virulence protein RhuM/Fic/DOC family protein [Betaproteobacteria bacterium]